MQDGNSANMVLLVVALFVPTFILMWVLVARIISLMGWTRLAASYAATNEPSPNAKKLTWQSLSFGPGVMSTNYNSCINAWLDHEGLYLRPSLMFRLFHPMLFLRWNQMQSVEETRLFLFKRIKVQMAGDVPAILAAGRLGQEFLSGWQQRRPQR